MKIIVAILSIVLAGPVLHAEAHSTRVPRPGKRHSRLAPQTRRSVSRPSKGPRKRTARTRAAGKRFTMKIIRPPRHKNFTMLWVKPNPNVDYRILRARPHFRR